jgi:tetratricopeptide (TPR) repeat protein
MKEYAPGIESAKLSLVDMPTPSVDVAETPAGVAPSAATEPVRAPTFSSAAEPVHASVATEADRFLTKAIHEHTAGHIDTTLWARALAQAGGDSARAKDLYVQSRATALRVTKREKRAARHASVVEALSGAPDRAFPLPGPEAGAAAAVATGPGKPGRGVAKRNRKRVMIAAGALGSLVVVAGLVMALSADDPLLPNIAGNTRLNPLARSTPTAQATPATTDTGTAADASGEDFVGKVRALEKEGNWHIIVLYAVEWTRKQPDNAEAWKVLSQGYIKLRQLGEAQDAATKAVQLAPDDFLKWQNLGQINLAIQLPAQALEAFDRATVLNDHDVISLVQAGILHGQFGHLAEARTAFAKALAVNPQDIQALCGATSVAQKEGRMKDAQEMTRQMTSLAERCGDQGSTVSVRVAAREPPRVKTTP